MMRKQIAMLAGYAVLCAVALTSAQSKPGNTKISGDVVKIGVLSDMSGVYSDIGGKNSIIAAQMAVDTFGGKILGKPIEVVSADHQNKADIGANKAREWFAKSVGWMEKGYKEDAELRRFRAEAAELLGVEKQD